MSKYLVTILFFSLPFFAFSQQIAITFDDAPMGDGNYFNGKKRTDVLIKKLKKLNIPQVAFFVTTSHIDGEDKKQRILHYAKAGHVIANHSHAHQRIGKLGTQGYIEDIHKAHQILHPLPNFRPWFRYPFLDEGSSSSSRDSIRTALTGLGYSNGYVTVDNYDWYLNALFQKALQDKKKVDYQALKQLYISHLWESMQFYNTIGVHTLGRSPKHVLLLHENDLAALFINDLVKYIQSKGWEIISPVEAYKDPISIHIPDVLLNGQGRIAAIAKEKGYKGPLVQESEEEEYLDKLFAELKVAN